MIPRRVPAQRERPPPACPCPLRTTPPGTPRCSVSSRSGVSWRRGFPHQPRRNPSPAQGLCLLSLGWKRGESLKTELLMASSPSPWPRICHRSPPPPSQPHHSSPRPCLGQPHHPSPHLLQPRVGQPHHPQPQPCPPRHSQRQRRNWSRLSRGRNQNPKNLQRLPSQRQKGAPRRPGSLPHREPSPLQPSHQRCPLGEER